jgi:putative ABC transport system ATP-binding protein
LPAWLRLDENHAIYVHDRALQFALFAGTHGIWPRSIVYLPHLQTRMIETRSLQFSYEADTVLRFADVDVPQGGTVLLSGVSGSGKSTWLALVAALVKPQAGSLTVAGACLTSMGARAADAWRVRTIGFLPQKLYLSASLSVQHNMELAYWAAGLKVQATRIRDVLGELGVADLAQRLPAQLSGGQAQRVALARAVLMQPSLILADEPTASLDDASAQDAVQLLVRAAQQHGATLVIATHDTRVAWALQNNQGPTPILLQLGQPAAMQDPAYSQAAQKATS